MAKKPSDLFKLPLDVRQRLEDMISDIEAAKSAIATLQKLGIDTREMEDKLSWAEQVRETLLKEFA
jgi:myo-inositol catabolism protein IolC